MAYKFVSRKIQLNITQQVARAGQVKILRSVPTSNYLVNNAKKDLIGRSNKIAITVSAKI